MPRLMPVTSSFSCISVIVRDFEPSSSEYTVSQKNVLICFRIYLWHFLSYF